jgi:hypothetical protein
MSTYEICAIQRAMIPIAFLIAACTTTQPIARPDGRAEYLIACGASSGWNICYDRANEVCPTGWETLAQDGGFNRKELHIYCPPQQRPAKH